ncbi:hypothetical protein GCM10011512_25770 [Tersicoccus solisilvae]|uniref:Uncharacterized protein n=1 Tax=Tersicoccus solisilvae TaxID=1882339 RepID=A0ABQ1PIZ2_9MICC|nr:hypothetical protein [Tersicoccus solisilvae]GGC97648.1 hypothetical protein GCM10011512_25770 [Tersicoccus solisilvae]
MISNSPDQPNRNDAEARWRRYRRLLRAGQAVMALGGLVLLAHWIAHLQPPPGPSAIEDIFAGYPAGVLLLLGGGIMAGQRHP